MARAFLLITLFFSQTAAANCLSNQIQCYGNCSKGDVSCVNKCTVASLSCTNDDKLDFIENHESTKSKKPNASIVKGKALSQCIKFSGSDVYNACSVPVYGTFCSSTNSMCECTKAKRKLKKRGTLMGLGCALTLKKGGIRKNFLTYNKNIRYVACSKPYTSTSGGVRIVGIKNGRFQYRCGS